MLALVNVSEPAMDTLLILSGFLAAHTLGAEFVSSATPRKVRAPSTSLMQLRLLDVGWAARQSILLPDVKAGGHPA